MVALLLSRRCWRCLYFLAISTVALIITWNTLRRAVNMAGLDNLSIGIGIGTSRQGASDFHTVIPMNVFKPGTVKPIGETYSKMIVLPRTKREDVSWITQFFNGSGTIKSTIYVADDPSAPLHPPKNKGHEVMVYLTYIIDHYDSLADVNIFMHSHRYAWHSNELLDNDAVQVISQLSAERVQREGYMNLRCHWDPGCPDWMHPGAVEVNINKQEEIILAKAWSELFPSDPIPNVLGQPCCSQFAISKDRIRSLPKASYVVYRDWLLQTQLSDFLSGRVWEYIWHYVFTGQNVYCPKEHICYCDGFGVCFGGEDQYNAWWDKMWEKRHYEDELKHWHFMDDAVTAAKEEGRIDKLKELKVPEFGKDVELEKEIAELEGWLRSEKQKSVKKGLEPMNRAKEAGREWKDGDGF